MSYAFRKDLFEVDGEALSFDVSRCHDAEELESIVEFGGGRIDLRGGPHTITCVTRNSEGNGYFNPHRAWFCSDYILKCCVRNTLLPLRNFVFDKKSTFVDNFDPTDILLRNVTWENAQEFLTCKVLNDTTPFKNPPGSLIIDGKVPTIKLELLDICPPSPKRTKRKRHEFTEDDRQTMVTFLVANPNFNLKSQNFWRQMAEELPTHTWESLKGHFRNKIYPSIDKYHLSEDILKKISNQLLGGFNNSSDDDGPSYFKRRAFKARRISDSESEKSMNSSGTIDIPEGDKSMDKNESNGGRRGDSTSDEGPSYSTRRAHRAERISDSESVNSIASKDTICIVETETNKRIDQSGPCCLLSTNVEPKEGNEVEEENGEPHVSQGPEECNIEGSELISSPSEEKQPEQLSSMTNINIHCKYDEVSVQTEDVEILPLPEGCDYPTTFEAAVQLMTKLQTNETPNQLSSPKGSPSVQISKKITPKLPKKSTKASPLRRSPRQPRPSRRRTESIGKKL